MKDLEQALDDWKPVRPRLDGVFMVNDDLSNLLWIRDNFVVNGHWHVVNRKGDKFVCKCRPSHSFSLTFVMDPPCKGDYNKVLNEVHRIIDSSETFRWVLMKRYTAPLLARPSVRRPDPEQSGP